jgi:hypothetical protein
MMAAHATKYYLGNIKRLATEDYVSVTYEQLCRQPQETIDHVMHTLNHSSCSVDSTRLVSPRHMSIDPTIQKLSPYIMRAMRPYCTAFGYTTTITD